MKSLVFVIFFLVTGPLQAANIITIDCVDLMNPSVTITYVFDQSRKLAQIKTQRFKPAYNAFYAAIVPVEITESAFVIHTQTADRKPFNDIEISRATGDGKVSTMPDVKLKCGPSAREEIFSEPILVPDRTAVISVTCANLPPEKPVSDEKSVNPPNLIIDTNSKKVFSFFAAQAPAPYGRIVDQGRDFIRFCIPHDCQDIDGEETGVLNVVNGAYALLKWRGGRLAFVNSDRAQCKASVM